MSLKKIISNNIDIYENTKILSIERKNNEYICKTKDNIIHSKYVVLALHYPYFTFPFLMPLKCHLEKSYITAFQVPKNDKFSAINTDDE